MGAILHGSNVDPVTTDEVSRSRERKQPFDEFSTSKSRSIIFDGKDCTSRHSYSVRILSYSGALPSINDASHVPERTVLSGSSVNDVGTDRGLDPPYLQLSIVSPEFAEFADRHQDRFTVQKSFLYVDSCAR